MKIIKLICALLMVHCAICSAQVYKNSSTPDKMWGRYCYRELNGRWYDALTSESVMSNMPNINGMVLAYYYRIPAGHARADIVWQNTYGRFAKVNVKVVYPHTGQVLGEGSFGNSEIASKERVDDLFGDINFPADDFYRIELSCDNWSYIKSINYFNYYRESADPVLIPRNFGGTSAFLGSWGSTDPDAPEGKAYDWAYIEAMVPWEHIHSGTYYMVLGTPGGYMGMQTNAAIGTGGGAAATDFERNVLFSQWDAENQDEGFVPEHKLSKILDGNLDAVHTHAGGEGSSASFMFQRDPKWWRHDHWVQFLLNTRPITVPVTVKTARGTDSTFNSGYTVMSTWYKCDTMPEWRYIGTIRAAGYCENIGAIYQFIEPFTSACGQERHRVYYRNCAFRSANSGRWYHRNNISIGYDGNGVDRRYHLDIGRGSSQDYDNCFFLDMGGYVHQHDSADIVPLAKDMTFCDTINLDALSQRVDQAMAREDYYNFNLRLNQCAPVIGGATWTVMKEFTNTSGNANAVIDGDDDSHWETYGHPSYLALKASEPQTISSFEVYWTNQYGSRMHYADVYTSEDGQNWQLRYDSLVIRCLDRIEVNLPQPITTKYLRLKFHHKYVGGDALNINELTFRGAWDFNKLKALAADVIAKAGTVNNYYPQDIAALREVYADGSVTDSQALADALYNIGRKATLADVYNVTGTLNLAADHSYYIQNAAGLGVLGATADGQLTLLGATDEQAYERYKTPASIGDSLNNWVIIHDDRFAAYYLYNVGARKFLNTEAKGYLSTEPQQLQVRSYGRNMYFNLLNTKTNIGLNPASEQFLTSETTLNNRSLFVIYDNLHMQQSAQLADSLNALTEPLGKLALYKAAAPSMLSAPVGVVGGFATEEAREALQAAYDNVDTAPQAFIEAVEHADVIEFDPDNAYYRIKAAADAQADAPYMTADATMRINCKPSNDNPDQIWHFASRNQGYTISSQGAKLSPLDNATAQAIILYPSTQQAGTYALSQSEWGQYFIGPGEYAKYVVSSAQSPLRTTLSTTQGATWYLEPAQTTTLTLNSAGVATAFYEYSFALPDNLSAYIVISVTPDGVMKLSAVDGVVPANTAVVLKGEPYQRCTLQIVGNAEQTYPRNMLKGVYFKNNSLAKGTFMTLATSGGQAVMKKPTIAQVNANQGYILLSEEMPALSTYTFDFDDIIDHIAPISAAKAPLSVGRINTISGLPATSLVKGNVYIRNHKKIILK